MGYPQSDRTFGGANDDAGMSIVQTRDDGYIVTGRTASFGPGDDDIWPLKVDHEGQEQWNRTFGGSGDDAAFQVMELEDGYALTGRSEIWQWEEGISPKNRLEREEAMGEDFAARRVLAYHYSR